MVAMGVFPGDDLLGASQGQDSGLKGSEEKGGRQEGDARSPFEPHGEPMRLAARRLCASA